MPRAFESNDALCSLIKRNFQCSGGFNRASLKAHLVKLCVITSYPAHLGEGVGKFSRNIQEDIVLAWNKNRSGWKFELETKPLISDTFDFFFFLRTRFSWGSFVRQQREKPKQTWAYVVM